VTRTNGTIECDIASLIKRGNDLRTEAEELNRTAEELTKMAARLMEDLAKQKRA
jgi:hypothetical protein